MSDTAWVQLIGFLTLIVGGLLQYFNAQRQHQWDVEDRAMTARELATKVQMEADKIAHKVEVQANVANAAATIANTARTELAAALKENTDVSTQAFKEANHINNKLAQLGLDHNALQQERQDIEKEKEKQKA